MYYEGFPGGDSGKEPSGAIRDAGLTPGLGRSPGGGQCTPLFLPGESPWTEEPGRLLSMGLQKVGYD